MGRIWKGIAWAAVLVGVLCCAWVTHAQTTEITVTSSADIGPGTLRNALSAGPGSVIRFDPASFPLNSHTVISVTSPLPPLQQGTRLLGARADVVIDGSGAPDGTDGLVVSGPSVEVSDLTVRGFKGNGILIGSNARSVNVSRTDVLSNTLHGILIRGSDNRLEDNVVSGNQGSGIRLEASTASGNAIAGNIVGLSPGAASAMPNALYGIEITSFAHDNLIGEPDSGNVVAGNGTGGIALSVNANRNRVVSNRVGMDANGTPVPGHPAGGILIADGAYTNTIGGPGAHDGNWIGNSNGAGIVVRSLAANASKDNAILGNSIGWLSEPASGPPTAATGNTPSNPSDGILIGMGALRTRIEANSISANTGHGIEIVPCAGATVTRNSISGNQLAGIHYRTECVQPPVFVRRINSYIPYLRFKAPPGALVEFFYDDADEGRMYVGSRTANIQGYVDYIFPEERPAANITATSTDKQGNTSEFSLVENNQWTVLLYLSGDNDLGDTVLGVIGDLADGQFRQANVLALADTNGPTALYDLSSGRIEPVEPYWGGGELNMGDAKTLKDFVAYGFGSHPARYKALIILDHGGGWGPPNPDPASTSAGSPLRRDHRYLTGGGSGLSWDDSNDSDYLNSIEMREALVRTGRRMDVLFYDVCVMGMVEVAYQVRDSADFFVSSQNLGWAPEGNPTRYREAIRNITATTTPSEFATDLVNTYNTGLLPEPGFGGYSGHPYTVAAIDTRRLPELATAMTDLSEALKSDLRDSAAADRLYQVYADTQKVDYNTNLELEQQTEGYVDLYDLAAKLAKAPGQSARVITAADAVTRTKAALVVAEHHESGPIIIDRSGSPQRVYWNFDGLDGIPGEVLNGPFDGVNGLSVYLPFGEDAMLHFPPPPPGGADVPLRSTYKCTAPDWALDWVCATHWDTLIERYYRLRRPVPAPRRLEQLKGPLSPEVYPPVPSEGPLIEGTPPPISSVTPTPTPTGSVTPTPALVATATPALAATPTPAPVATATPALAATATITPPTVTPPASAGLTNRPK
ncbi:MAG: clostripain-related cysteine peptidase [Nitrososphaerales archaeon]